jgi:hypothetical protein
MNTHELLTQIGAAMADDADDLTKQRGVNACRTVLTILGATVGEPMQPAIPAPSAQPVHSSPLAAAAQAMSIMPTTAILDAVIAKLQAQLSPDASAGAPEPQPQMLRIPFIPVPNLKGRGT